MSNNLSVSLDELLSYIGESIDKIKSDSDAALDRAVSDVLPPTDTLHLYSLEELERRSVLSYSN